MNEEEAKTEAASEPEATDAAPPLNRAERRAAARKGGAAHANASQRGGQPPSRGAIPPGHAPGGMPPGKKASLPRKSGKG
jgi:hypothetical protein